MFRLFARVGRENVVVSESADTEFLSELVSAIKRNDLSLVETSTSCTPDLGYLPIEQLRCRKRRIEKLIKTGNVNVVELDGKIFVDRLSLEAAKGKRAQRRSR